MPAKLSFLGLFGATNPLTSQEGQAILERDQYRCQYCGLDGAASFENSIIMTVDFVVPRARKGKKDAHNLVAACRPCNLIKGHRVFRSFDEAKAYVLAQRAKLHKEWEQKIARLKTKSAAS